MWPAPPHTHTHNQRAMIGRIPHREHDDRGARWEDDDDEQLDQVQGVHEGEAAVAAHEPWQVPEDEEGVGEVGEDPAAPLFDELADGVRAVRAVNGVGWIAQLPSLHHHQSAHPPVLACCYRCGNSLQLLTFFIWFSIHLFTSNLHDYLIILKFLTNFTKRDRCSFHAKQASTKLRVALGDDGSLYVCKPDLSLIWKLIWK